MKRPPVKATTAWLHIRALEGMRLLHLEGADLSGEHLEGAVLDGAHLENAMLIGAHLEWASLYAAHLEGADFLRAHLEGVNLGEAHLEGASLAWAHLGGQHMSRDDVARIRERVPDFPEILQPAELIEVFFDRETSLNYVDLGTIEYGYAALLDVRWGEVNLAAVNWTRITRGTFGLWRRRDAVELGEERRARDAYDSEGKPKTKQDALLCYLWAVRTTRQVSIALRNQGLSEDADRFAYKSQKLQRQVLRLQRNIGAYLFSLLLAALSGYGYRIGHIVVAYALVVGLFAAAFLASDVLTGQTAFTVQHTLDALQISLNAVHGRVFFAQFQLDTLQSWLATAESIFGIVIEGVFVAMLIQRFFSR